MDKSQNPLFSSKKPVVKKPTSFVEALLETGGRATVRAASQSSEQHNRLDGVWQNKEDEAKTEQLRWQQHKEVVSTKVFDREEEERKAKIAELLKALEELTDELGAVAAGARKAIKEELVHPGTYHVAFFEALKRFLVSLKKRVTESKNWLAISAQRKRRKSYFWGQVDKSGTKFLLSQERTSSTQGG